MLGGAIASVFLHRRILLNDRMLEAESTSHRISRVNAYFWRSVAIMLWFLATAVFVAQIAIGILHYLSLDHIFTPFDASTSPPNADNSACIICILVPISTIALMAVASYFPTRFSLALPATAIARPHRAFSESWKTTRGHFWKLFCGGALCSWPTLLSLVFLFSQHDIASWTPVQNVMFGAAMNIVAIANTLIWVAFYSFAYRALTPDGSQ
jgi:hypothetical protein